MVHDVTLALLIGIPAALALTLLGWALARAAARADGRTAARHQAERRAAMQRHPSARRPPPPPDT